MLGTKLKKFAQAGIHQAEGRLTLGEKTMKQASQTKDIHLPAVSSSTGAAVTAIIRGR
ncbi:MAG TPA: hypothetical protein VGD95_00205 [Micavibrio sp.]